MERLIRNAACRLIVVTTLMLTAISGVTGQETFVPPEGFVSLFNGRDFTGWEGNLEFFRIDDGAVIAGRLTEPIPRNEFLCTERQYGDFELRLQVKGSQENVNGGIQIRSQRIPNHHEVSGYQVDTGSFPSVLLRRMYNPAGIETAKVPVDGNSNIWGSLYDESRRNKFLAVPDQTKMPGIVKPTQWNDFQVRCEGRRIQIWVNGFQTVDYTEPDDEIAVEGIIGLQIHSGPAVEISYRNICIKEASREDQARVIDKRLSGSALADLRIVRPRLCLNILR